MMLSHSATCEGCDTRTFHFPLERNSITPPQMTVVLRRSLNHLRVHNMYEAGVSFCSSGDQFSKRKGRQIARGRLESQGALVGDGNFLRDSIVENFQEISERHGRQDIAHFKTLSDLDKVLNSDSLEKLFCKDARTPPRFSN